MPVKIRLQRHGKKGKPYYWIVAADARSKRDGKYLEKLGAYNPNTNPATIELNVDGAVTWLQNGAQPTDTARAILSYKGALLKNHLAGGVRKGALTEEQAEAKFNAWLDEKAGKVDAKKEGLAKAKADAKAKALEAEKAVNEARAAVPVEEVTEEPVAEEVIEEAVAEESTEETTEVAEEATKETTVEDIVAEEPVAEEVVADEPAVEEATEEPVAEETTEDTPVVEEVAEETAEDAPETKTEASKEEE
jgi:small subunit ribosomal protein S16